MLGITLVRVGNIDRNDKGSLNIEVITQVMRFACSVLPTFPYFYIMLRENRYIPHHRHKILFIDGVNTEFISTEYAGIFASPRESLVTVLFARHKRAGMECGGKFSVRCRLNVRNFHGNTVRDIRLMCKHPVEVHIFGNRGVNAVGIAVIEFKAEDFGMERK